MNPTVNLILMIFTVDAEDGTEMKITKALEVISEFEVITDEAETLLYLTPRTKITKTQALAATKVIESRCEAIRNLLQQTIK